MPHPDLGREGWFLGGGGPAEGLPQIIQINEFLKAGHNPKYIGAVSAPAWSVLNLKQAYDIWCNVITSSAVIWDINPRLKAAGWSVLKNIPHDPKHHPIKFAKQSAKLIWYEFSEFLKAPINLWKNDFSPENFSPFIEKLFALAKLYGLDEQEGVLDISPLVKTLRERIDLSEFWTQDTKIHIFVRSIETGKVHVFSNKKEDCDKGPLYHYIDSADTAFKVAQAATALRSVFNPVAINGGIYCDSGLANPFPVEDAFDEGCDTVFAFIRDYERYTRGKGILGAKIEDDEISLQNLYVYIKIKADLRRRNEGQKFFIIKPQYPLHSDLWLLGTSLAAIEHTKKIEFGSHQKNCPSQILI